MSFFFVELNAISLAQKARELHEGDQETIRPSAAWFKSVDLSRKRAVTREKKGEMMMDWEERVRAQLRPASSLDQQSQFSMVDLFFPFFEAKNYIFPPPGMICDTFSRVLRLQ